MSGRREADTARRNAGQTPIPNELGNDVRFCDSGSLPVPNELAPTRPHHTTRGRPPRRVHDPELEARIAANRRLTDHAEQILEQRRALAAEALAAGYPIRRVAELTGLHRRAVERLVARS